MDYGCRFCVKVFLTGLHTSLQIKTPACSEWILQVHALNATHCLKGTLSLKSSLPDYFMVD